MLQAHAAEIRDTISAVFRQQAYDRSVKERLWDRLIDWLVTLDSALRSLLERSPELYWSALGALALLVVAGVARYAYLARYHGARAASLVLGRDGRATARGRRDPWLAAQEFAAAGSYTEAAHALYRASLETLARGDRVRLHPSKTAGDYLRELRQSPSGLFTRFRDFVRSYETVVYGLGSCDREHYARLHTLASAIIHPGG